MNKSTLYWTTSSLNFSGELVALILQRENAIHKWREMLGPTSPYRLVSMKLQMFDFGGTL